MVIVGFGGEQKPGLSMGRPVSSEPVQGRSWQWHVSVLGPFTTVDMNHASGRVNIANLEIESFLHAKPQGVNGPKVKGDTISGAGIDDCVNLSDRQDFR